MENFLIYGAYGYTGELIAREAARRGLRPVLGGRDRSRLETLAAELELEALPLSLENQAALEQAASRFKLILHCAGPYRHTAAPMAAACLRSGAHYLDITGEWAVLEALASMDQRAREAGVMLLPAVGFDVVPTDCLAAHLKSRLPGTVHLALAIRSVGGGLSRGTARSALGAGPLQGLVRRGGVLTRVPAGYKTRQVDFGRGQVSCVSIPWGDVVTAYYSTGIPNIETYMALPRAVQAALPLGRSLSGLAQARPVQWLLRQAIAQRPPGPSAEQRAQGLSLVWGEAADNHGRKVVSRLRTPESYTLTSLTALRAVEKILLGGVKPGFQTPARAFGADFILEIDGVERLDL